jgi:hypothetical protein
MENEWVGKWTCRDGTEAEIGKMVLDRYFFGLVKVCGKDILTMWKSNGDHFSDSSYDLITRKRENEI